MNPKSILLSILKAGKKIEKKQEKIRKFTAPEDDVTITGQDEIIIRGASESDVNALNDALTEIGYKGKGLDLSKLVHNFVSTKNGVVDIGQKINIEELMLKIKSNNKELFAFLRRPSASIEEMVAMAQATGATNIANKFLKRKPGELVPAEDTIGGLIAMMKLGSELESTSKKILKTTDQGQKENLYKKLSILATIQSNLSAQVSGVVSEYGRGLAVVRSVSKLQNIDLTEYTQKLDDFVNNLDDGLIDYHANAYLALPSTGRASYARSGLLMKTYDVAMEGYINALLSSPITHIINMAGNSMFQIARTLETGLASFVGNVRTLGGRKGQIGDRVYAGEILHESHGLINALFGEALKTGRLTDVVGDAWKSSGATLLTGTPGDFASKIDLKNRRAIGRTDNLNDVFKNLARGEVAPSALDLLGIMTRIPGRFLATEDEFFKVLSERAVLFREAHREQSITYETLIRSGVDKEEATIKAKQIYQDIMTEPPQHIRDMMSKEAKIRTFQDNPEGIYQSFIQFANLPGMKIIVPFSRTPTNIVKEVFDRTFNYSPIYKALKGKLPGQTGPSGKEFDQAMSKLILGNSIFASFVLLADGYFGDDIKIIGSGPTNKMAKKIMRDAGVPQYSIGFKQEDDTFKYVTFSRFDPLSGILAMASDYQYYARNSGEGDLLSLEAMYKAGTLAVADYAMNMPFLQGVSELTKAMGNPHGTNEDVMDRFVKYFGEQSGGVVFSNIGVVDQYLGLPSTLNVPGATSFTRTLERVQNPYASNTMLNEEQLDAVTRSPMPKFMEGFYKALNVAKSGNPRFSDELEPALDFWGRPILQTNYVEDVDGQLKGTSANYYNPFRVGRGDFSKLDKEIISLIEKTGESFSFHRRSYNGIKFNDRQYNKYVKNINSLYENDDGKLMSPNEPGYREDFNLLSRLNKMIVSKEYLNLATNEEKMDMMKAELRHARELAIKQTIDTDVNLKFLTRPND